MKPRIPLLLTLMLFAGSLYAQNARISGQLKDTSEAAVPNAVVTAVNLETGVKRTSTSNDQGYYSIPSLLPGRYKVSVESPGFQTMIRENITLNVEQDARLDFKLQVGAVEQTVTVSGGAPLINATDGTVSTVVDRRFVENLPLNGRSFQSLFELTPGLVLTKAQVLDQGQFSVNGQRPDSNYLMIDGVSANVGVSANLNLGQAGAGALPGLSASGGTNNLASVDALQEFRIQTSTYAPEFGRTPGAQISITTRSGTNDFHGTIFDYLRNDVFDANDWFANQLGLRKPGLRQNDFGGVLGGPILKNKTFFFFSYEGLRLAQPQVTVAEVPSFNTRASAPPALRPFLNAFPVPNGGEILTPNGTPTGLAQLSASYSNPSSLNATSLRLDHTPINTVTLFARYNYAPSESQQRGNFGSVSQSLSDLNITRIHTQTLTLGSTWAITGTLSNEIRFNWSRHEAASWFRMDTFGGAIPPDNSLVFPAPYASPSRSQFVFFLNISTAPQFQVGRNIDNVQRQLNFVDGLSKHFGAHRIKAGVDYRRLTPHFGPTDYFQQPVFSTIGQVLTGTAGSVSIVADIARGLQFNNFSAYVQDTWSVIPRLSVTYGARWDVNPPPTGIDGKNPLTVVGLSNPSTATLAPQGTPLWSTTYGNVAPRLGVAWQLRSHPGTDTVVRGGFGIFYDLGTSQAGNVDRLGVFPYGRFKTLVNVPFPLASDLSAPSPFSLSPPGRLFAVFDPKLQLPRIYQWSIALEQSLGTSQSLSVTYLGAVGRRLLRQVVLSNVNPSFAQLNATGNAATSDYHALQLQFQRRLSKGLQGVASYTWSHSIDSASTDSFDLSGQRAPSDFDVRHAATAGISYNMPNKGSGALMLFHDWSLDTIVRARTATPVNVFAANTFVTGMLVMSRPNLIPGVPLYIDDPTAPRGRRINRAAFSSPPAGQQGNLSRNALRGFSVSQLDLALRRQFAFSERLRLQFRVDLFNLFNHPNFGDPGSESGGASARITSATFGASPSMLGRSLGAGGINGGFSPLYQIGGPRSVQFALKLIF